ncbi:MAG: pentapeptide repeat-containing protein [Phycisphaerales bacterium]|jgi:hypothetical protein|nr:pentapeptide repeat-containing protein [Phycisphaerales bacterium]
MKASRAARDSRYKVHDQYNDSEYSDLYDLASDLLGLLRRGEYHEFNARRRSLRDASQKEYVIVLSTRASPAALKGCPPWQGDKPELAAVVLSHAEASGCEFIKWDFSNSRLRGAKMSECKFDGCIMIDTDFECADLTGARFHETTMKRTRLVNAICAGADFRDARMDGADLKGANLVGAIGLWGPAKAVTDKCLRADEAKYSNDPLAWSRLRWSHDLRLVGVSYVSFVAGILYAAMTRPINEAVRSVRDWSVKMSDTLPAAGWLGHLPSLPTSGFFAVQLVALLFVAVGTTIYRMYCPEFVQLYSETEWTVEKRQSMVEYRAASASKKHLRWAAWFFIGTGSVYTVLYLLGRLWIAVCYLSGF